MIKRQQIDYAILILVFLLTIFGVIMLASASSDLGKSNFDDSYYYLRHQIYYGLSLGILGFFAGYFTPYRYYKKFAPLLLFVTIIGLILTLTPLGFSSGTGAARWINIGSITFQPAELLKITFILYLAAWLSNAKSKRSDNFWEGFMPFLGICGIIASLLVLEKSTSSVIIIMGSALAVYLVSGAKKRYVFYAIFLGIFLISLLVIFTPYRFERIKTHLYPASDAQGAGYQINRSQITIGAGGILGVGYGKSIAKKYLPERIGDSIFAIIAEEFGFVGNIILVTVFFFIVLHSYKLAKQAGDRFGKLLFIGFGTVIGIQVFVHIGSNSGLIPLTGVPLPFISYGGTALATFLTMSGIMLNISKNG